MPTMVVDKWATQAIFQKVNTLKNWLRTYGTSDFAIYCLGREQETFGFSNDYNRLMKW